MTTERLYNLRTVFGPTRGRELWDLDFSNIELRIWAYSCGNKELINTFETGGKVHEIICRELWGSNFTEDQYHWTKNGNFAIIYGAGRKTADATYKKPGAYNRIMTRFPEVGGLLDRLVDEAIANLEQHGTAYITTLGGYRLVVPPDKYNSYRKAGNFFIQGSAAWVMMLGYNECYRYCRDWNNTLIQTMSSNQETTPGQIHYWKTWKTPHPRLIYLTNQVHDSLIFDLPRHPSSRKHVAQFKEILEAQGPKFNIPIPVECKRSTTNWGELKTV